MNDYILIDVESMITAEKLLHSLKKVLPEYKWRSGDSDAVGPYVSGNNLEGVGVKFWLGEQPLEMAVSFNSYQKGLSGREKSKRVVLQCVVEAITPTIGKILKIEK